MQRKWMFRKIILRGRLRKEMNESYCGMINAEGSRSALRPKCGTKEAQYAINLPPRMKLR